MKQPPDFFLSTAGEFEPLATPRACRERARLRDEHRDDYMLVEFEPPLPGQRFGLGEADITFLVLSSRHQGQTLYPMSEWPGHVYVARVVDNKVPAAGGLSKGQIELVAWGAIFRSLRDASDYAASVGH